ncbi:MAG: ribosome assembly factor SBDS [Candidatus Methanomethylicia archaeon]|nr:ribosome assembly factor SBDS [Candidatus Methanomethylicia archaeon]MCX8169040.1 ribosome assembly factor SBDS [Candidatus Methanomethylicia archaeon]MDW7988772.1 ribosome assembly factor SBDS [Nitrososphaerota archaeon]
MRSKRTFIIARYVHKGERFEIIVEPNSAWAFKQGENVDLSNILIGDTIYKDSNKGLKASEEELKRVFGTTDFHKIAIIILKKGELQLTSEQRKEMIENKKKQIISLMSKYCVDPRTNLPHPPKRIELAIEEAGVSIDPFKSAEEQVSSIIKALRNILPIKIANVILKVKIGPEFAGKTYGVISNFGTIRHHEWLSDGSLSCEIELPAGLQTSFMDKLNQICKGNVEINVVR